MSRFQNPSSIAQTGHTNCTPFEPYWAQKNIDNLGVNAAVVSVKGEFVTVETTNTKSWDSCFNFACEVAEACGAKIGRAYGTEKGYETILVFPS